MKMKVIAMRGETTGEDHGVLLILTSRKKETGFVARLDNKIRSPIMLIDSFIKFGYWNDWPADKEPPISPEKMAQFEIIGGQ